MSGHLKNPLVAVWIALSAATLMSWALGAEHSNLTPRIVSTAVILVAYIKARLVGLFFMELRDIPRAFRLVFEGYCLFVVGGMLGMYFVG